MSDVQEAIKKVGDLCWEHSVGAGADVIFRVLYVRDTLRHGRRIRISDYFMDEHEAEAHVDTIINRPDCILISFRSYSLSCDKLAGGPQ